MRFQDQVDENTRMAEQTQNMCYSDYLQKLEEFNQQLAQAQQTKEMLEAQLAQFSSEKRAKLKFLATSLVSSSNLWQRLRADRKRQAFNKWQYNVSIRKIAEKAFGRVLELNHRHTKARYTTAFHILKAQMDKGSLLVAFKQIMRAAAIKNRRNLEYSVSHYGSVASKPNDMSHVVDLLSANNMQKIEMKNLYQK